MTVADRVGVGIIGTGFMASTHTEALRRLGIDVVGIAGRTKESAATVASALAIPTAYSGLDEMLSDSAITAVHVTTPNDVHAEQVRAVLDAGKHVVCEKPLGVDSTETAELVLQAADSGLVNAVCFNIRFSPHVQNAAGLVRDGAIGLPRFVTGAYLQDWLLLETDWNWRLVSSRQGGLRAVADIGSHWLDLVQFVTGQRVESVLADLHTFVPERNHPLHEVKTFAAAGVADDAERVREQMDSDDAAGILLRFDDGARGICAISQVSAGRKNRLTSGGRRIGVGAGVDVGGPRVPVDRSSRAAERGRPDRRVADVRTRCAVDGLPSRSRRGLPGQLQGAVRSRIRRYPCRRAVRAAAVPDVRGRPRRCARQRGDCCVRPYWKLDCCQ